MGEDMLSALARVPQVNVYGIKENQIVSVIEGETAGNVEDTVRTIQTLDGVPPWPERIRN